MAFPLLTDSTMTTARRPSSASDSSFFHSSAWTEAKLLVDLAVPTVLVQLGATIPPALTASYIGRHLGAAYLDGFQLASLTGNLLTLSLLQGLYSASDTLSPQAYGVGNYKEVGLIAMRGFAGSLLVLVPINALLLVYMESLLIWVGEDPVAARLAADWYRVYVFTLPLYALYNVTWKFLSAQGIMTPLVVVMIVSTGIILPLLLETLVPWMGFKGSAVAIVLFEVSQVLMLLLYLIWKRPHHDGTWPGLTAWRDALCSKSFLSYLRLSSGGMLASSEWWYWEALCLLVGTLGVIPLSVHTIPTQVISVSFMIPIGVGIALSIRLGVTLPHSVGRAKRLVIGCFVFSTLLFAGITALMYTYRRVLFRIFTSDEQVLAGCEAIWWKVVLYYFVICIFGVNTGVATGLGMQWTLGVVNTFFLWVVGLPAVYLVAVERGGGLDSAWTWIIPPYVLMNVALMFAFVLADWREIQSTIRKREGVEEAGIEAAVVGHHHMPHYGSVNERSRLISIASDDQANGQMQQWASQQSLIEN